MDICKSAIKFVKKSCKKILHGQIRHKKALPIPLDYVFKNTTVNVNQGMSPEENMALSKDAGGADDPTDCLAELGGCPWP